MDAWIFIAAFTFVTMTPFMASYDNPDAEWAAAQAEDEGAADEAAEHVSDDSAAETDAS